MQSKEKGNKTKEIHLILTGQNLAGVSDVGQTKKDFSSFLNSIKEKLKNF